MIELVHGKVVVSERAGLAAIEASTSRVGIYVGDPRGPDPES